MKKLFFLLFLVPSLAFSQSNNTAPSSLDDKMEKPAPVPAITFTEQTWDYGNIPLNIPAQHTFEYTNSGNAPLIVSQATASCGCTTPVWSKEPVLPAKRGTVAVTYNAGHLGTFMKTVTVLSNTGEPVYLTIKGNVVEKSSGNK